MPLRFDHIFMGLMGLSALAAFVVPSQSIDHYHPQVAALFAPVAQPAAWVGTWAHDRVAPPVSADRRSADQFRRENDSLRAEMSNLQARLENLSVRMNERDGIGPVGKLCTMFSVAGSDTGTRESLLLRGSSLQGLREGLCVLYPGGIAGQIRRAGVAGAQVQLVTDLGFRVRAAFRTFRPNGRGGIEAARRDAPAALVEGIGKGIMVVRMLPLDQVRAAKVSEGDLVVLNEPDWPAILQGQPLGKVTHIGPRPGAPLYAEIRIEPQAALLRLREVMVVTKE